MIAAILGAVPHLSGWTTQHPEALKISIGLALAILAWLVSRSVLPSIRSVRKWYLDRRFVRQESMKLGEFIYRLRPFVANETTGLITILRAVGAEHMTSVSPIINAPDYVPSWRGCFQEQLKRPAVDLDVFLARYRELLTIVNSFNRDYVHRAHRTLSTVRPLGETSIADLEQFREEFAAYLRDFELWGDKVYEEVRIRTGNPHHWTLAPKASFDKVKSFRRSTAADGNARQ